MLARTTTLHALLEEYPFLEGFLVARGPVFERLAAPGHGRAWARGVRLGELLVPAALHAHDDDDWEAVAELERLVG